MFSGPKKVVGLGLALGIAGLVMSWGSGIPAKPQVSLGNASQAELEILVSKAKAMGLCDVPSPNDGDGSEDQGENTPQTGGEPQQAGGSAEELAEMFRSDLPFGITSPTSWSTGEQIGAGVFALFALIGACMTLFKGPWFARSVLSWLNDRRRVGFSWTLASNCRSNVAASKLRSVVPDGPLTPIPIKERENLDFLERVDSLLERADLAEQSTAPGAPAAFTRARIQIVRGQKRVADEVIRGLEANMLRWEAAQTSLFKKVRDNAKKLKIANEIALILYRKKRAGLDEELVAQEQSLLRGQGVA